MTGVVAWPCTKELSCRVLRGASAGNRCELGSRGCGGEVWSPHRLADCGHKEIQSCEMKDRVNKTEL